MEHAILHENIDGQQVNFYPETGFDDVMQTDGDDEITLRMVLEGMDAAIALLQNGLATKADKATTLAGYGITNAYTKSEANSLLNNKANNSALNNYLPLSGGALTGSGTVEMRRAVDDGNLVIRGCTGYQKGATLALYGQDNSVTSGARAGAFTIQAYKSGVGDKTLLGHPDGTLTWDGNDIITKSGGIITGKLIGIRFGENFIARSDNSVKGIGFEYNSPTHNRGLFDYDLGKWVFCVNDESRITTQSPPKDDNSARIATSEFVKQQITYQDFTVNNVSYSAGTIGTRGTQVTIPIALSGHHMIGAEFYTFSGASSEFVPVLMPFSSNNNVYINLYRASTNALSNQTFTVRVWYRAA